MNLFFKILVLIVIYPSMVNAQSNCRCVSVGASTAGNCPINNAVSLSYIDIKNGQEVSIKQDVHADLFLAKPVSTQPSNFSISSSGLRKDEMTYTYKLADGREYSYRIWKKSKVTYSFAPGFSERYKLVVESVINELSLQTNLCFDEWVDPSAQDVLMFSSMSMNNSGYSALGRIGGIQHIVINKDIESDSWLRRTIAHELGHALGLFHEQQLPSSEYELNIHLQNICPQGIDQYKKIVSLPSIYLDNYSRFSVMHYHPCQFIKKDQSAFTFKDGHCPNTVGFADRFSASDIKRLNFIYDTPCKANSTLFLFDLSGSMNDHGGGSIPKVEQAKLASKQTLDALRSNSQGIENQVAAYGFSGGCVTDPTIEISPFDSDLSAVEQRIYSMSAGGGTPLGNAIRAAECKMASHLIQQGQKKGKLIILSDGAGTCGNIRPPGVYNSPPLQRNRAVMVDAGQCGLSSYNSASVSYFTVGFNIAPGSAAERDLQYLSKLSGGKYLNVQNQAQLARAFRKFNRIYQPKRYPALSNVSEESQNIFSKGVNEINEEYFEKALSSYEEYSKLHPDDCHGVYNLALALEALDYYKEAIYNYKEYLALCPSVSDRSFVENQIKFLEEEFREFVRFQKAIVTSDLEFLKLHFERIQNGHSIDLATEFKGFLLEKGDFYDVLPRLIGSKNRFLKNLTSEMVSSFRQCSTLIRKSPETWDRDAIPLISMSYLNLEELLDEM